MNAINPADSRRVAIFDRFIRNSNHLLKGKSTKEIEKLISDQEGFIHGIKDIETKERLLGISQELRDTALASLQNFDSVMSKLKKCETLVKGKPPEEISNFFDEVDGDIAKIPNQRMRQTVQKNSSYWKVRWLDDYYVNSSKATLDKVSADKSLAGKTVEEVKEFFTPLQSSISKISDPEVQAALFNFSEYHKKDAIQMIELASQPSPFLEGIDMNKQD